MCYDRRMTEVASRELRNNTRKLLRRVEAGEDVVITVDGRPVALLRPVASRARWISKREFVHRVVPRQADAKLDQERKKRQRDSLPNPELTRRPQ